MTRSALSPAVKVGIDCSGDGRAKQAMKAECDINNIMAKYVKTGAVSHFNAKGARYGDVPAVSYHEALNTVIAARELFEGLPAKIRTRFQNDPGQFLAFVQDPNNTAEAVELGLATARPAPEPSPSPAEPSPAP